jgi:ribosome biogenesis GTPase
MMNNLMKFGMSERFANEATLYSNLILGRVISQYSNLYRVVTDNGELLASVSGKYEFLSQHIEDYPVVGDFVMLDRDTDEGGNGIIHHTLQRKSAFKRKAVGVDGEAQVVSSNIDIVFICMAMNENYNLRRLERYLSVAWDSGATPIVLMTKSDLCNNPIELLNEVRSIAIGSDVLLTSSKDESAFKKIMPYLKEGITACFIGSSGVGKSTLINKLLGNDTLETFEIREKDGRGRHTTTRRELLVLPGGGIVIDTPGMRELGIDSADISKTFSDIDELISKCRFSNCSHTNEPSCAVLDAIQKGQLSVKRYGNYQKLKQEMLYSSLNAKQIENEKISKMFGSKNEMKQKIREVKNKNRR